MFARPARALERAVTLYEAYRDAVPTPKPRLPEAIQFPINDICNSRCQMCFIWKNKREREISPDEVRIALGNRLFRKVSSVGINGGEPTLRQDIGAVADAICDTLPSLKAISLITNAWKTRLTLDRIDLLAEACRRHNVGLDVMVSLDGYGSVHDRVRGREGNFESACHVLSRLRDNELIDSVRIGCTIIKENVFDVESVLNWARDNDIYARFRMGIPHQRLYTKDCSAPFVLSEEERYHVAIFLDKLYYTYEWNEARRAFYRSLRDQLIYGKPRTSGCAWKSKGVTLLSNGDLGYCAVESKTLGNAVMEDASDLYWGNTAHLREIVENKCASCLHDYEGVAERTTLLKKHAQALIDMHPLLGRPARLTWRSLKAVSEVARVRKALPHSSRQGPRGGYGQHLRSSRKRFLLTGWYGTETAGDKAILGGVVDAIRSTHPDAEIDLSSIEPYVTRETLRQMPDLDIQKIIPLQQAKEVGGQSRYDCAVIAGGPLMASIPYIVDLLEIFSAVKGSGGQCIVAGCGIGPLGDRHRNRTIGSILQFSDRIVLRDRRSVDLAANSLGVKSQIEVAHDPAFEWCSKQLVSTRKSRENTILLALRDWPLGEYAADIAPAVAQRHKRSLEREIATFVDAVARHSPETRIVPICMHTLDIGDDDREFYRRIFRGHQHVLDNLSNRHRPPAELLAEFATARAILAMRFHSVVFSIASETPFLAIDYSRGGKIAGLLTDIELENRCIDPQRFDGESMARRLLDGSFSIPSREPPALRSREAFTRLFTDLT